MKMLLWKEFRQSSRLLIACGVLLVMPYVVAAAAGVYDHTRMEMYYRYTPWPEYAMGAAISALGLCALLSAFVGANAIASERSDRSAEFLAYLPIPRVKATACKAGFAISVLLAMFVVNIAVTAAAAYASDVSRSLSAWEPLRVVFAIAVFLFGTAWLGSTMLRTPGNAAAAALGSLIVLYLPILLIEERRGWSAATWETVFIASILSLGLACFVGGTVYYLRKASP